MSRTPDKRRLERCPSVTCCPHIATGGMCDLTPEILSAQVFAADGVTPVAGKGPLNQGSDYSLNYSAAPNCQLDINVLTAAGTIGPNERLILRYRTQLDANTQNGVTLTNVAGAIQWFNADSSNPSRKSFTGPLTNGTPGILDNQDAYTVTLPVIPGSIFDKTVADLTSGVNPAKTAAPATSCAIRCASARPVRRSAISGSLTRWML